MTTLRGARVLITGATGGIGRTICDRLHQEGCELVVTGRRHEALAEIASKTGARTIAADLGNGVEDLLSEVGDIDVFISNAAIPASGDLEEWDPADIDRAMFVNLGAPIAMTRAFLPAMRARGWGHFVYMSSLSGKTASRGTALYAAAKFGLRGFSAALRCDLRGSGVGCSVICPGFVRDAGMFADTGLGAPPFASVTSGQVAGAVLDAIHANRAEISVAPLPVRVGASIGGLVPGLSAFVQDVAGGDLSDRIISAQRGKR